MDSATEIFITALSIVGLSGIVAGVRSSRRLSRYNRFFRFRRDEPVDIVLTTSARTSGGYGISYMRSVTAVGNLKGATEIAQTLGYGSANRPISVSVSAELDSELSGDLILIGLPGKNEASRLVLWHLARRYGEVTLTIDESPEGGCALSLGPFTEKYEVSLQQDSEVPTHDLALIILWVNPLAKSKRRLILCAGFTSYGTAAAAHYLVNDVVNARLSRLREEHSSIPSLWGRDWICFAMIIEARLINDQVVDVRERAFVPLEDPGCPPFDEEEDAPEPKSSGLPGHQGDDALGLEKGSGGGAAPSHEPVTLSKP